jgi:hypothetical protein
MWKRSRILLQVAESQKCHASVKRLQLRTAQLFRRVDCVRDIFSAISKYLKLRPVRLRASLVTWIPVAAAA